jgi:hypothetical protein
LAKGQKPELFRALATLRWQQDLKRLTEVYPASLDPTPPDGEVSALAQTNTAHYREKYRMGELVRLQNAINSSRLSHHAFYGCWSDSSEKSRTEIDPVRKAHQRNCQANCTEHDDSFKCLNIEIDPRRAGEDFGNH